MTIYHDKDFRSYFEIFDHFFIIEIVYIHF